MFDNLKSILDDVTIDAPWELVERFATFPRWKPEDVNASCDMMVERLKRHGVPVTVHEADLYLSIPYEASVQAEGKTYRAIKRAVLGERGIGSLVRTVTN